MFDTKMKACKFRRLGTGRGSRYVIGGGALGQYRISKMDGEWQVFWTGGSARKAGTISRPTLDAAKKFVAYRLGCKYPARKR